MKIKPKKYEFHQTETEYLGFIISQKGTKTDPVKTAAVWDWAKPTKVREVQKFTGFCNFYRRFIEGFSKIARPLYNLTKKGQKWDWKELQDKAFQTIKEKLTTAPLLIHYNPKRRITIETDASDYVCAGVTNCD